MADTQNSECWLDKYLYQTIGRLYYELTQAREETQRYKGFFEHRKARCQELEERFSRLHDVEWDNIRLRQEVKRLESNQTEPDAPASKGTDSPSKNSADAYGRFSFKSLDLDDYPSAPDDDSRDADDSSYV
jgi:hypothetical protein